MSLRKSFTRFDLIERTVLSSIPPPATVQAVLAHTKEIVWIVILVIVEVVGGVEQVEVALGDDAAAQLPL